MRNRGQGLIELVISVGVIMLVLAGTVGLIIFSIGKRNRGFDRNTASRLAQVVIERLVESKKDDAESFWDDLTEVKDGTLDDDFDGFLYSVEFGELGCGDNCVEATVTVSWQGDQELQVSRLFAK